MENTHPELISALNWRYAAKKFDPEKQIPDSELATLLEAVRLTASSYGLQPYRFILVKNPEIRQQLRGASFNQAQVTDASHFLVFAAKADLQEADTAAYMQLISDTRGIPQEALNGFADAINGMLNTKSKADLTTWATKQAYIAVGNLLTAAALMGIDACPMEGFDSAQYDEILGLSALGLASKVVVALGYRSSEDALSQMAKVRLPKEQLFIEM